MTLLIGVAHVPEHLEETLRMLDAQDLAGKSVMVELAEYPVPFDQWIRCRTAVQFFDSVARHCLRSGAHLLLGEDQALRTQALRLTREVNARAGYAARNERWNDWRRAKKTFEEIANRWRNPHFAEVAATRRPDIIVLGNGHIPYLVENVYAGLPHTYVKVPHDL